jgi:hypothetical protein
VLASFLLEGSDSDLTCSRHVVAAAASGPDCSSTVQTLHVRRGRWRRASVVLLPLACASALVLCNRTSASSAARGQRDSVAVLPAQHHGRQTCCSWWQLAENHLCCGWLQRGPHCGDLMVGTRQQQRLLQMWTTTGMNHHHAV